MTPDEHVERFKSFADRLKAEGMSDRDILSVFRSYLHCAKNNERDRQEKRIVWRFKA